MAMTVRIPADTDAAVQRIADELHTSKHALVLRALEEFVSREEKTARILQSVERTSLEYAELIERLKDS